MMVLHGMIIGLFMYFTLVYVAKQSRPYSEKNAVLIGASSVIYMVIFGHNLPSFQCCK